MPPLKQFCLSPTAKGKSLTVQSIVVTLSGHSKLVDFGEIYDYTKPWLVCIVCNP